MFLLIDIHNIQNSVFYNLSVLIISFATFIIAVLTLLVTKKIAFVQQWNTLMEEYRSHEFGKALKAVADFFINDCEGLICSIQSAYLEVTKKEANMNVEDTLNFQRRMLAQYYWHLDVVTKDYYRGKHWLKKYFNKNEMNILAIVYNMSIAEDANYKSLWTDDCKQKNIENTNTFLSYIEHLYGVFDKKFKNDKRVPLSLTVGCKISEKKNNFIIQKLWSKKMGNSCGDQEVKDFDLVAKEMNCSRLLLKKFTELTKNLVEESNNELMWNKDTRFVGRFYTSRKICIGLYFDIKGNYTFVLGFYTDKDKTILEQKLKNNHQQYFYKWYKIDSQTEENWLFIELDKFLLVCNDVICNNSASKELSDLIDLYKNYIVKEVLSDNSKKIIKNEMVTGNKISINRVDYGVILSCVEDEEKIVINTEKNNTPIVITKGK